jgi:hypothetical protein
MHGTFKKIVKPDVFSLESLIAWLEKQPAETNYGWGRMGDCLLHQYLIAHGQDWRKDYHKLRVTICDGPRNGAKVFIALHEPHTFGAALARARKVLEDRQ